MIMFHRISLTIKMLILTVAVGLAIGGILNYFQTQKLRGILYGELTERLKKQAQEDRLLFDNYVSAHYKAVTLIVSQKRFLDYIDRKDFYRGNRSQPIYPREVPPWLPEASVLRSLVYVRYAILLDAEGNAREIYQAWPDSPPESLIHPSDLLRKLSSNQSLMTKVDGIPFLITSKAVTDSRGKSQAALMLASPIDSEFLIASQGLAPHQTIVALMEGENPRILASKRPDLLPAGTGLGALGKKYLITGKSFFDLGSSDLLLQFVSFIPTSEAESLTKTILSADKRQRAIITSFLILSFALIMFWITRHIQQLTKKILDFSQHTLGMRSRAVQKGDELRILEIQFQSLIEEVIEVRGALMKKAEENARLYEETKELSLHDPLTGLWNHEEIFRILERELARAGRESGCVTVFMADLDHFKKINDAHGHQMGDSVLRMIAGRMLSIVRPYDAIGRYGGEEFMVILPGCDKQHIASTAERFRATIEGKSMNTPEGMTQVTVSIGVATSTRERRGDVNSLVRAADSALYRAKEKGRNRVEVASDEEMT